MQVHLFHNSDFFKQNRIHREDVLTTLERIAHSTNTSDLVVALYIIPGYRRNRGTAYVRRWMTPARFIARTGKWAFARKWGSPPDLPQQFKLIRMRLDGRDRLFPRTERDIYGWEFHYLNFLGHLATLFAHELHHFRRYHLNLHPREGEQSANKWALQHVQKCGFQVEAKKHPVQQRRRRRRSILIRLLSLHFL
ncbi:hypothetical protein JW824_09170 [bacterium]|nr:hypothetical protein [bacterium]